MPLLRIFDTSEGAREVEIGSEPVVLGRDKQVVDICLKDQSVSRKHLKIYCNDGVYYAQDLVSTCGTQLNNNKLDVSVIKSGDNLQLGSTVIEFSTDDPVVYSDDQSTKSTIDFLLSSFRALPSGMQLEYRVVKIFPADIFATGDTIVIGRGGLLVKESLPLTKGEAILELKFVWPDGNTKLLLGEVVAIIESYQMTCVKLHSLPGLKFQEMMDKAVRSSWSDIVIS